MGDSKPLYMLSSTIMMQSFTYVLFTGILVMFMIEVLHFSDSFSTYLFGIATGSTYLFQILGGYLCDRYLGNRKSIILGLVLITISMAFFTYDASLYNTVHAHAHSTFLFTDVEKLFLVAVSFMALGVSFFKVSITSFLSMFYKDNEEELDSAFSLFYMFINIGGFFAPLVITFVVGVNHPELYQYGFLIGLIVILIGLIMFIALKNRFLVLPDGEPVGVIPISKLQKLDEGKKKIGAKLSKIEIDRFKVVILMLLAIIIYYISYQQIFTSLILFVENGVKNFIPFLNMHLAPSAFITLNPIFIVLLTPLHMKLFNMLASKNKPVSSVVKIGIGLLVVFLAFGILALGDFIYGNQPLNMMWIIAFYFIFENAELLIMPVSLSLVSKLAPEKYISSMIGVNYFIYGIASIIGGYCASSFPKYGTTAFMNLIPIVDTPYFFMMFAIIGLVSGVLWLLFKNKIISLSHGVE